MSKLKKLLVGFLALVLTVTMMPVQATMTAYAAPTIDESKTGSITIHKYEYNGSAGVTGTGSENDTVPTDAKGLNDVKFQVTKVADLTDYYGTDGEALISLADAQAVTKAATESIDFSAVGNWKYVTTENDGTNDGIAKLKNLPLGIYLVQEIEAPAQITGKTADFLVSIPMTNADETDWLYDVHVYPKNKSTYGEVTLKKMGQVGNDEAAALGGATFVLQKKIDDKWTAVTVDNKGKEIGDDGVLTTGTDGMISASDLAPGDYRFIETSVPDDTGYIMDGVTGYEFTIADKAAEDGSYEAGAVLVDGKPVDTSNPSLTVTNYKPDLDKEVQDRTTSNWKKMSDYNIGDTISYKITIDVPANITELKKFDVTDTPTNLEDKVMSIKLTYVDGSETKSVSTDAYTKADTDAKGFTINFVPANMAALAGKTIVIEYSAVLLSGADVTVAGNPNTVKLVYSNNILPENEPDNPNNDKDPKEDAIEDTAIVYTFKLQILKTAKTADGSPLANVMFDLYKEDATGTITGDSANAIGLDKTKKWVQVATGLTTNNNGIVEQLGLANGTYCLVETKTADGYNLLKAPVEVTLDIQYVTTIKKEYYIDKDGVQTLVKNEIGTTTFTVEDGDDNDTDRDSSNGTIIQNIINNKGFTLPTTGGMGTIIFMIVGGSMMLAAVLLLLMSKKKEAR